MPQYINPPPQNPLTKIIAAVIAAFVLVGSFMIGIAALVVVVIWTLGGTGHVIVWLLAPGVCLTLEYAPQELIAAIRLHVRTGEALQPMA